MTYDSEVVVGGGGGGGGGARREILQVKVETVSIMMKCDVIIN